MKEWESRTIGGLLLVAIMACTILLVGWLQSFNTEAPAEPIRTKMWIVKGPNKQCSGHTWPYDVNRSLEGGSMMPSVFDGDVVYGVYYNASRELNPGNIVLVEGYLHRVTMTYTDYYITQGDNNQEQDTQRHNYTTTTLVACAVELS